MPTPADAPLRKVTLNLYEADCAYLEKTLGHGWTTEVRNAVHEYAGKRLNLQVTMDMITDSAVYRTLGDLDGR
jgi:hypothetical protein